jgi:hypothetical protein
VEVSSNGYGHESTNEEEREFRARDTVGRSTILYILDRGDVAMRCNVCCTVYDTTLDVLRKGKTDTYGDCKPYESGLCNRKPMKSVKPEKAVKQEKDAAPAKMYYYVGTRLSRKQISDRFKVSTTLVDLRRKAYMESNDRTAGWLFSTILPPTSTNAGKRTIVRATMSTAQGKQ